MLDEYNIPGFSLPINTSFSVRGTLPPLDYLKFPPADLPKTLLPPPDHPTLAHPFTIRSDWYNGLLSANVPITIALIYATVVTYLNSVNHSRKYKPWAFSQTQLFKLLVIVHNIFLAVYSGWTFIGMVNALSISFVSPTGPHGLAGTVDSLCKINGPRGIGSAAVYDSKTSLWGIANRVFHLGADGLLPESSDVGRIWNEGLAFYGWLFYVSKFYEVVDTFIILAKGKKSSLLQTYHHAGAMLCMWAGIRYMSPPIWMFVLVNSFIHTVMYTFYFCTAIGIKVPVPLKKTLTTMQIAQFVVGASYAFGHLFIKYQSPVSVPYLYHLGDIASAVPSDASSAASFALATASAGPVAWLKKAALRAAGREGLAENIWNEEGKPFGIDAVHAAQDFVKREEMRYRDQLHWVPCLDTSGQVFAILLNCLYLAPLTMLFVKFFIKAYTNRIDRRRRSSASAQASAVFRSGEDASKGVVRQLSEAFEDVQTGVTELGDDEAVIDGEELKKELKSAVESAKLGTASALSALKDQADQAKAKFQNDFPVDFEEPCKAGNESEKVDEKDEQAVNDHVEVYDGLPNQVTEDRKFPSSATTAESKESDSGDNELLETDVHPTADPAPEANDEGEELEANATEADPAKHANSDIEVPGTDDESGPGRPSASSTQEDTTTESSVPAKVQLPSESEQLMKDQKSRDNQEIGTDQEASWIHVSADEQHQANQPERSVAETADHQSTETTEGAEPLPDQSDTNDEVDNGNTLPTSASADTGVSDQVEERDVEEKSEQAEQVGESTKEDTTAQSATEPSEAETPNTSPESHLAHTPEETQEVQPVVLTEQPSETETTVPVKEEAEKETAASEDHAQHSLGTEVPQIETLGPESVDTTLEEKARSHSEDAGATENDAVDLETQQSTEMMSTPGDSLTEKHSSTIEHAPTGDQPPRISSNPLEDDRSYAEVVAEEPAVSERQEAELSRPQETDVAKVEDASHDASVAADNEEQPKSVDTKESPSMDEKLSASAEEPLPPVSNTTQLVETDGHDEKGSVSEDGTEADAASTPQKSKRRPPKLEIRNTAKQNEGAGAEDEEAKAEQGPETPPTESQASKDAHDETIESDRGTPSKDGA